MAKTRPPVVVISGATGGIGSQIGLYLWRNSWNTIGLSRQVHACPPPGYDSMGQCNVLQKDFLNHYNFL